VRQLSIIILILAFPIVVVCAGLSRQLQPDPHAYDNLPDPRLVTLLKSISGGLGRMDLYPQDSRYLYDLILKYKLTAGLEIESSRGYSAVWLGMAFRQTSGRLVCIANSPEQRHETLANLSQAALLDRIDLRLNDAFEIIPTLSGPYDLVFLDGPKRNYGRYLRMLLSKVRPGGFIIAHNVADQSSDVAEFIRSVTTDPLLKTELVSISPAGLSVTQKLVKR
jgi:predicted O-methyltransferase YrrM